MSSMRAPADLVDAFRADGLKVTPQRRLLFELLHANPNHPTADELFSVASGRMPGISLRTVYQTLTDLVAMGELRQLTAGTDQLAIDGASEFRSDGLSIVFHGRCAACAGP